MIATPAIRDIIREAGRTADILKQMADGRKQLGSQTYQQHLEELVDGRPHLLRHRERRLTRSPSPRRRASEAPSRRRPS